LRETNKGGFTLTIINSNIARAKHQLFQRMRNTLDDLGFCEVSSPIQLATPKSKKRSLRECMELKLRSALASGLDSVYEIGQCFRAEKVDETHLAEFHMLELFWNRPSFTELTELTRHLLEKAFLRPINNFETVDLAVLLPQRYPGFEYGRSYENLQEWVKAFLPQKKLVKCDCSYKIHNLLIDNLLDEMKPGCIELPAMVINYPKETICLACPQEGYPERIQRAEFFVDGLEIGHGFVDDMNVQSVSARMMENGEKFIDKPFLALLASGRLPASSGVGLGLDRLLQVLLGLDDIRQCVHELQ
jgi:lysyl-tRNA synthetase class 2